MQRLAKRIATPGVSSGSHADAQVRRTITKVQFAVSCCMVRQFYVANDEADEQATLALASRNHPAHRRGVARQMANADSHVLAHANTAGMTEAVAVMNLSTRLRGGWL